MLHNIKRSKEMILSCVSFSFRLLIAFIDVAIKTILIIGAISAFMLLVFMFPEKSLPISNLLITLLGLFWNLINASVILIFISTIIYIFVIYYELIKNMKKNMKKKREKEWDKAIDDIVNRLNKKIRRKK